MLRMTVTRQVVGLLVCLAVVFAAAAVGAPFTARATNTWYVEIERPAWTPPNWVFGPVWTMLYLLMAVAVWLVWREGGFATHGKALTLFVVQLVLNAAWTPIFFGARWFGVACIEIVLLWLAILLSTVAFVRIRPVAGWLLVPYLLWVSYASTLNAGIWWLNR